MADPNELKKKKGKEVATGSSTESASSPRSKKAKSAIQRLYDACKEPFGGADPGIALSPDHVARIKSVMDHITLEDVNLSPRLSFLANDANRPPRMTCFPIYEGPKFTISIFCLPRSVAIALHNRPGMTIFSKLLVGTIHIISREWTYAFEDFTPEKVLLSNLKTDAGFTAPCETVINYPAMGGSLDCLTTKTDCAVLEVFGRDSRGRVYRFFEALPYSGVGHARYPWEGHTPTRLSTNIKKYTGPKIVEQ